MKVFLSLLCLSSVFFFLRIIRKKYDEDFHFCIKKLKVFLHHHLGDGTAMGWSSALQAENQTGSFPVSSTI